MGMKKTIRKLNRKIEEQQRAIENLEEAARSLELRLQLVQPVTVPYVPYPVIPDYPYPIVEPFVYRITDAGSTAALYPNQVAILSSGN